MYSISNTSQQQSPNIDSSFLNLLNTSTASSGNSLSLYSNTNSISNQALLCNGSSNSISVYLTRLIKNFEDINSFLDIYMSNSQTDILNNVIIDVLEITQNAPRILNELQSSLNSLFYELKATNDDLTTFINNISLILKQSTQTFNQKFDYTRVPVTLYLTYQSFYTISKSLSFTNLALKSLSLRVSGLIGSMNGQNFIKKIIYCNITYTVSDIMNEISKVKDIFTAYSQLNAFISYFQETIFYVFMPNRYEQFLVQNFNITNTSNYLDDIVNSSFLQFNSLTGPIEAIMSFNNVFDAQNFSTSIINLESTINSTIETLMNSTNFALINYYNFFTNINQTITFLYSVFNFSQNILASNLSSYNYQNKPLIPSLIVYSNNSFLSYILSQTQETASNLVTSSNSWFKAADSILSFAINSSSSSIVDDSYSFSQLALNTSYYLEFVCQINTNNSNDIYANASKSLGKISQFSSQITQMLSDLPIQLSKKNFNFLNEFINLTRLFINNDLEISLPNSIDSKTREYLQNALSTLNKTIVKIQKYLILLYPKNTWQEWQPWLTCVFVRVRQNLQTNQYIQKNVNISCSSFSILFFFCIKIF
jgi:hypothetical protein